MYCVLVGSILDNEGQIVIPKEIREVLGYEAGDAISFELQGDKVILEKLRESMGAILKKSGPLPDDAITFQRNLREEWS